LPLALSTGALITTDRNTANALGNNQSLRNVSDDISYIGSGYSAGGVAAAFYVVGRAIHNDRARETGLLSAEALIDSSIWAQGIKFAAGRERPLDDRERDGEFFKGGSSFPSGHATASWSVATVIAHEYHDHLVVQVIAYSLAAAVSVARYTSSNHFLSDSLIGSALGFGIGRYVYRAHHDRKLDEHYVPKSKLYPSIFPHYDGRTRGGGVTLAWSF
jgi:membrane-associated phospholipid phosphatase